MMMNIEEEEEEEWNEKNVILSNEMMKNKEEKNHCINFRLIFVCLFCSVQFSFIPFFIAWWWKEFSSFNVHCVCFLSLFIIYWKKTNNQIEREWEKHLPFYFSLFILFPFFITSFSNITTHTNTIIIIKISFLICCVCECVCFIYSVCLFVCFSTP